MHKDVGSAVVDCGVYDEGHRQGGLVELDTALAKADACQDGFVWIGLHDPSPKVVEAVGRRFELHPLAVEDAVNAHQRPKLEVFGDTLFLVLKTARHVNSAEPVEIGEVMVFAGPRFVVTVRHGEGSPLHDVRLDLEAHPDLLGIGPSSVLYAVADRIVDDYAEVLERLDIEVDAVEADVFSRLGADPTERIYKLKREVLEFKRAVAPLVAPMQRLATDQAGLPLDPRTAAYFRDVNDHLIRDAEGIAGLDELLTGVLQANFAQLDGPRQPGPAQDLELGRDRRGADDDLRPLRHELRAHARARLAVRLSGRAAGRARSSASRCTASSSGPAGSRRRSGSRRRRRCGCSAARRPRARSCAAGWRCGCAASRCRRRRRGPTPRVSSARWVISRPRLRASTLSSSNSIGVRWTSSPSRWTRWAATSIASPSACSTGSSGVGAARRSAACRRATSSREPNGLVT